MGSCLCGAVRYRVTARPTEVVHCHCSMCRKMHGAAFATYGGYWNNDFERTSEEGLKTFESASHVKRQFCEVCGSSLFWKEEEGRRIWVALGTLDGDPGRPADCHIFVESKATWYEITDSLPQFQTWPHHGG